ncbi:LAETG motif-containing sortase-dependent surface protein [Streptomyces sp. NPDC088387]|uniref:excalibur calcium-binding domain-containing protein n=1 Tax=Streptomyces sp. NPDC088387 TaxID=3365859 RepID=UPI00381EC10C
MNLLHKRCAIGVAALALAALPSTALAHDGDHPFANCTDAYANGYANIEKGDEHYGPALDRDKDGVGCDAPPADFKPADDEASAAPGTDLAETGGNDNTPYLAAGGALIVLAGGAAMLLANRRNHPTD